MVQVLNVGSVPVQASAAPHHLPLLLRLRGSYTYRSLAHHRRFILQRFSMDLIHMIGSFTLVLLHISLVNLSCFYWWPYYYSPHAKSRGLAIELL